MANIELRSMANTPFFALYIGAETTGSGGSTLYENVPKNAIKALEATVNRMTAALTYILTENRGLSCKHILLN